MSLVVFPFKEEAIDVVAANLRTAANHQEVHEVWAVAAAEDAVMADVAGAATEIAAATATPVVVFAQERLGVLRSGKGDGMNTAISRAAERGFGRTHFYDADITNFDDSWIDGAENAADRGFGVVRHRFPRAATDAMITWMVTRPGLAKLFPGTLLPRLGQPLGGELLMSLDAVERLAGDPFVTARSDWGIDTVITHATSTLDLGIYEHNAPDGKRHALYNSLSELRDMVIECLDAVASLKGRPAPHEVAVFGADPPAAVPDDLKTTVAYDIDATRASIAMPATPTERAILDDLGVDPDGPHHIGATEWGELVDRLIDEFDITDPGWHDALFRLWVQRVITYTSTHVRQGYDHAMGYLEETIHLYEAASGRGTSRG